MDKFDTNVIFYISLFLGFIPYIIFNLWKKYKNNSKHFWLWFCNAMTLISIFLISFSIIMFNKEEFHMYVSIPLANSSIISYYSYEVLTKHYHKYINFRLYYILVYIIIVLYMITLVFLKKWYYIM